MEVSTPTIIRMRKMINDQEGENNTFSDEELEAILLESACIYSAAAEAWMIKASLLQGDIESYSTGNEKYDMTSLKDKLNHALKMTEIYQARAKPPDDELPNHSVMLKFRTPDVM